MGLHTISLHEECSASKIVMKIRNILDEKPLKNDIASHHYSQPVQHANPITPQTLLSLRRKRDTLFGDGLFSEPAWDILLDLYCNRREGKQISITSACIAANVPMTTALRWIGILETKGLIERFHDPKDARRTFVCLSNKGYSKLKALFGSSEVSV